MRKGNNVIIGVSASIAIYKSLELISLLKKRDITVRVAMTKEAANFISPVVFQALTNSRVYVDVLDEFDELNNTNITHIALSNWADVFAVVPATSNIIAKMANGFSDDAVSLIALATEAKKIVAPAMNSRMYLNRTTLRNIKTLKDNGFEIIEPIDGNLACNTKGVGHIAEVEDIADAIEFHLYNKPLQDRLAVITAGPTIEPIDPVRYITNRSSGKMGFAIAKAAQLLGANTVLISGPTCLKEPYGVKRIDVDSANSMLKAIKESIKNSKHAVLIMAAAIADYRPKQYIDKKIKKDDSSFEMSIELAQNPDLTVEINKFAKENNIDLFTVGFAAETNDLLKNAARKIKKKNLQFIVANDVSREDIGFSSDENEVHILHKDGKIEKMDKMDKIQLAFEILRRIKA